ncbi:F510_1955 family glycosylhydrolase [Paramicrobacterium agarici]|uniref:F510_1955 family glycosylhydrolase n=1 Tax=Paramicrobacterium agarici TaxID=630514 RepID=UPI001152A4A5|nr:sialidase family protein [Microbacterium agarici]TQO22613.1 hypothetical protein FB385_1445 [Microbacterium agarici]
MKAIVAGSVAALVAFTVIALAGCTAAKSQDDHAASADIAHIHALSAAEDGTILVASHSGIFRVDDSGDEPVIEGPLGGVPFDAMGFVALDGNWYTSGHPGTGAPENFEAPNLGLLASEDDGKTWMNVSLSGEADFHALTASPGDPDRLYGLRTDMQAMQVSNDGGATWSSGASLVARNLLADNNPEIVYATTEDGLARSTDGGKSFTLDEDTPPLVLIAADPSRGGGLVGIDTAGTIWHKQGDGTWVSGGIVEGVPQALTVASNGTVIVALEHGILTSDDFGESWTTLVDID